MTLRAIAVRLVPPIIADLIRGKRAVVGTGSDTASYKIELRKIRHQGAAYFLPQYALHRPACSEMLAGRFYEPDTHQLVSALLKELGGNMVHAGTFFGDMLPSFAGTGARIYAFEPVLENYVLARLCVIENELTNVLLYHCALGESPGTVRMDTGSHEHKGGGSHVSATGQIATLVSIDSISPENVSVIQLDVEGYELPALKGASQTIDRDNPVILIEDNKGDCGPFLQDKGYVLKGMIPGLQIWTRGQTISALEQFG